MVAIFAEEVFGPIPPYPRDRKIINYLIPHLGL
jgi:hypothetical protein